MIFVRFFERNHFNVAATDEIVNNTAIIVFLTKLKILDLMDTTFTLIGLTNCWRCKINLPRAELAI
jgi:hypothetical protein